MTNLTPEQQMAMAGMSSEEIAKLVETYKQNQNATFENNLAKVAI